MTFFSARHSTKLPFATTKVPASRRLLMLKPDAQDRLISQMIAEAMLETDRQPYWFSINHDIRPPKNLACPLHYDWILKDRVGIKTLVRETARKWIAAAAMHGYQISREGGHPLTTSIAIARRRAENHQRPRTDDEDDIPF